MRAKEPPDNAVSAVLREKLRVCCAVLIFFLLKIIFFFTHKSTVCVCVRMKNGFVTGDCPRPALTWPRVCTQRAQHREERSSQ